MICKKMKKKGESPEETKGRRNFYLRAERGGGHVAVARKKCLGKRIQPLCPRENLSPSPGEEERSGAFVKKDLKGGRLIQRFRGRGTEAHRHRV